MDESINGAEGSGGTGEFFAVDWRSVETAAQHGINAAVGYLALARFTFADQATTRAGNTAIHTYTALSRKRSEEALDTLERIGLVSKAEGASGWRKLRGPSTAVAARMKLTPRQTEVLNRLRETTITSSTDRDYQVANELARKGILERTDARGGEPLFCGLQPDWVWLPNTLVTGATEDDRPLARLRQIQDARAVPVLMGCYREANLAEDGGLHWRIVRSNWKRVKVGQQGPFTIWGFVGGGQTATWKPLFERFYKKPKNEGDDNGSSDLWAVWGGLCDAGLIEHVCHLVESAADDAQVLHVYALPRTGEEIERKLQEAARDAGRRMVTEGQLEWARGQLGIHDADPWLCPVRSHIKDVQLIGIARPVYRPRTKRTAAWAANFLHRCVRDIALYESLGRNEAKSVA